MLTFVDKKLSGKALAAWEKTRDLTRAGAGRRPDEARRLGEKDEFFPLPDGSIRRIIRQRDGTVEKDHLIPSERAQVAAARATTGFSQTAFARLLGVSARTLQDGEQGRKAQSGAAATPLKVTARHPHG